MSHIHRLFLLILIVISCRDPLSAQSLIFLSDSAIRVSCENRPPDFDSHKIYNTTDEMIVLRWKRTQFQVPDESAFMMIFDGAQYFPFVTEGIRGISAHDTVDIIFQFWHDTILPGDSVIVQIVVYDEDDSLNTAHYQTVIQHCPLQTSYVEPALENLIEVFPNPVIDEMKIKIPEQLVASSVVLYNVIGEKMRKWPITGDEIILARDGLPGGIYFIGLESHGQTIGINKVVLTE